MNSTKQFQTTGCIGRWKPLHLGGEAFLEALCKNSEKVLIGIGSTNKYNARCPFTAQESAGMIDAALSSKYSNYSFVFVPDFGQDPKYRDGQKWKEYILREFEGIDYFFSGNPYVKNLLEKSLIIRDPYELIQDVGRNDLSATIVRTEMARGEDWKDLVSEPVYSYIKLKRLDERFQCEFGRETLDYAEKNIDFVSRTLVHEKMKTNS